MTAESVFPPSRAHRAACSARSQRTPSGSRSSSAPTRSWWARSHQAKEAVGVPRGGPQELERGRRVAREELHGQELPAVGVAALGVPPHALHLHARQSLPPLPAPIEDLDLREGLGVLDELDAARLALERQDPRGPVDPGRGTGRRAGRGRRGRGRGDGRGRAWCGSRRLSAPRHRRREAERRQPDGGADQRPGPGASGGGCGQPAVELVPEGDGGRGPGGEVAGHGPADDGLERGRDAGDDRRGPRRVRRAHLLEEVDEVGPEEGRAARQALVEQRPEPHTSTARRPAARGPAPAPCCSASRGALRSPSARRPSCHGPGRSPRGPASPPAGRGRWPA